MSKAQIETTERRFAGKIECRGAEDGSDLVLVGYAVIWNAETQRWPGSFEVFRRGCFIESLGSYDTVAYWVHEKPAPLARMSAGTLLVEEDETGLKVEIRMANTAVNQDRYASIQRGDVKGMSIGFIPQPDGQRWSLRPNGDEVRELTRATLTDVGPHPDPQYPETMIEARARWDAQRPKDLQQPAEMPVEVAHAQARATLMRLEF